jgi:hypothetical protein
MLRIAKRPRAQRVKTKDNGDSGGDGAGGDGGGGGGARGGTLNNLKFLLNNLEIVTPQDSLRLQFCILNNLKMLRKES